MARAVNQTIAWIAALFLSLLVFGVGLAIVFSLKPKHRDDHGAHDEHETAAEHEGAEEGEHHGAAAPEHPADGEHGEHAAAEAEHPKPKIEHEDPHAKEGGDEEKEITPASVKAKAEEHVPEAKPHH